MAWSHLVVRLVERILCQLKRFKTWLFVVCRFLAKRVLSVAFKFLAARFTFAFKASSFITNSAPWRYTSGFIAVAN
ncbi:hypothetical protein [Vibrio toranzoniae]|uniref:hypothetical protein n=1 Tax=Vibrio toranzoniae TaxID=1194427 RepID=UPI00137777DC|nr:hypothetical protein [Vibrio toranzoniae]